MIKIEDVSEPLTEAAARVSEAVLLFCQVLLINLCFSNNLLGQGIGLLPSITRRFSSQISTDGVSREKEVQCDHVLILIMPSVLATGPQPEALYCKPGGMWTCFSLCAG